MVTRINLNGLPGRWRTVLTPVLAAAGVGPLPHNWLIAEVPADSPVLRDPEVLRLRMSYPDAVRTATAAEWAAQDAARAAKKAAREARRSDDVDLFQEKFGVEGTL